jgi:hypothetical protein
MMVDEVLEKYKEWIQDERPFKEPHDVCNIPIIKDKEIYRNYFIPALIKRGGIPKKDLEDGVTYIGNHRRCQEARWDKKIEKFIYQRYKFGQYFEDTCNHFEDDDNFALFVPIRKKQ